MHICTYVYDEIKTLRARRLLLISAASNRRVRSPFLPVSAARSLPARSGREKMHLYIDIQVCINNGDLYITH